MWPCPSLSSDRRKRQTRFYSLFLVVLLRRSISKHGVLSCFLWPCSSSIGKRTGARRKQSTDLGNENLAGFYRIRPPIFSSRRVWHTDSPFFPYSLKKTRLVSKFQAAVYCAEL